MNVLQRFATWLGQEHRRCINAYSEDLPKKIVEAKGRGLPTIEVASAFGAALSSVKRRTKTVREGGLLRPKRSPGRRPKADERSRRPLEADLGERPAAATLSERREYLRSSVAALLVSESTTSRLLPRLGWTRKKDRWERARQVLEGGLARARRRDPRRAMAGVRGRDGFEHLARNPVGLDAQRRAGALVGAAQRRQEHDDALGELTTKGMGPRAWRWSEAGPRRCSKRTWRKLSSRPPSALRPGQVVVLDDLKVHKGEPVRRLVVGRGCELLFFPPYSPDLNPIEEAFSKLKGASCVEPMRGRRRPRRGDGTSAGRGHGPRCPRLVRTLRLPFTGPTPTTTALAQKRADALEEA